MGWYDNPDADYRARGYNEADNSQAMPGTFDGFWSGAGTGLKAGALNAANTLLTTGEMGVTGLRDALQMPGLKRTPEQDNLANQFEDLKQATRANALSAVPDNSVGTAGHIAYGLGKIGTEAVLSSAFGVPAPIGIGLAEGIGATDRSGVLVVVFCVLLLGYVGKFIAVLFSDFRRVFFRIVDNVIRWCQKITNGYASGAKHKKENSYNNSRENQNQNRSEQSSQQHSQNQNKSSNSSTSDFEERLAAIRSRSELCFEVLGLKKGATASDIKVAYKRSMSKYHPDRVTGLGEKIQQLAEEETKLINAAYQTLKRLGYC